MTPTCFGTITLLMLLVTTPVMAQPTMDQLWPNPDGMRFDYLYHWDDARADLSLTSPAYLELSGTVNTAGGTAQNLYAGHADLPAGPAGSSPPVTGLLGRIWQARPDLRDAISTRYARIAKDTQETWHPFLLHDGYFLKTDAAIEMWQANWPDHATWTYLQSDIAVGATFSHQLIPELAADIFLYGTIGALGATVVTLNGTYDNAVRVDYFIDYGSSTATDENGNVIGTIHAETRGHVHYVPNVGPVEMLEEFWPYETIDCGAADCPPEWSAWVGQVVETQTLTLTSAPIPSEAVSWGEVKTLFR